VDEYNRREQEIQDLEEENLLLEDELYHLQEETDMVKICAEITEKASKWKNFNVKIAVDEYNRIDQEIKDLEEETSLLEDELDHLRMELNGIK